jgi:hypothetical protein
MAPAPPMRQLPGNHTPRSFTASFSTPFHPSSTHLHPSPARPRWLTLRPPRQRAPLHQVEAETRENHLHPDPLHRRHQHMPSVEHPLDHAERTLPKSPLPVDPPVPEPVPDAQRTTPHSTPHRGIPAPGAPRRSSPGPGTPPHPVGTGPPGCREPKPTSSPAP